MDQFWSDARMSLRIFRRSPALALSAVIALAMGIGFTTTMFGIVRGGTRPLPVENPDQIVALTRTSARGYDVNPSPFDYLVSTPRLRRSARNDMVGGAVGAPLGMTTHQAYGALRPDEARAPFQITATS